MKKALLILAAFLVIVGLLNWPSPKPDPIPTPSAQVIPKSQKAQDRYDLIISILDADAETLPELWKNHQDHDFLRPLLIESWGRVDPNHFPELPLDSHGNDEIFWTSAVQHHGEKILEISKGRRHDDPFVLACLARNSPHRALEIFNKNPKRFEAHSSRSIKKGVLIGLAKQDPHLAIDYYLAKCSKNHEDSFHELIRDWLVSKPEDALRWIAAHDAFDHSYHFEEALAYLSQENSEFMASLAKTLPTRRKKHLFEKVLSMEEIPPDCLWIFENRLTSQERKTTHSFRSLLTEAMECPPADFKNWWSRDLEDHLGDTKEALILEIVRDRWCTFAPAECVRRQVPYFDFNLVESMEAWLKVDEATAINFPLTIASRHSDRYDASTLALVIAIGRSDVPKALAVLADLPDIEITGFSNRWIGPFSRFAKMDREGFLKHAPMDEKWRETSLAAFMEAWLTEDFEETMRIVEGLGATPEILARELISPDAVDTTFYQNYHLLSPPWQKTLIGSPYLYEGLEKEWLLKKDHPQMTTGELEETQYRAGHDLVYQIVRADVKGAGEDFKMLVDLIREGNWLGINTRTMLSETLMWALIRDLEKAGKILKKIPEQFRGESNFLLEQWKIERQLKEARFRMTSQQGFLEILKSAPDEHDGFHFERWGRVEELGEINYHSWTRSEFESVEVEIDKLSLTAAREAFGSLKKDQYWTKIAWDLFNRCCHLEDLSQDFLMQTVASHFAKMMAERNCPAAGEWALALPPSGVKNRAISEVFRRWQDYNKTEALAWAKNLPPETQRNLRIIVD